MSETRTDVASTPVSTLFSLEPLSFDVAKAYETLDHIATCSECEDFIDTLEDIIDTLRKTDGALDDVQKLRLINEVQFVALKVSRKSIRLQNREIKELIDLMFKSSPLHPLHRKRRREAGTSAPRFLLRQAQ
ncbi:hypothetical protein TNIN_21491 [Trichonephila inaurata madagascariensis]|uniref:Uncharacterized protein n=1 Tax=Trichonephila inaurata madagascariensis TaxID=2747483 RepID=A0A8X7C3Y7_9ARAC|nr:hypothetical protein TNIN_21491 [Trichonephila inaurata madagascariensis]